MGNCQAVDAAVLVIQHPCGKLERMYWSVTASQVMKTNPGHYVSLIIPLPADHNNTVRFTSVKLLRPTDTLLLGRAYRLVTTQEVMKVVRAKKNKNMKQSESETEKNHQAIRSDRHPQRAGSGRPKSWRPSLQSISEAAS